MLLSSVGGSVLAAGQAGYAAASTFLDGLAAHRAATGRVATAVAPSLWDVGAGFATAFGDADRARMTARGLPPLGHDEGLALVDAALDCGRPAVAAVTVDPTAVRGEPATHLRDLVAAARTAAGGTGDGEQDQAQADRRARTGELLRTVRERIATVLATAPPPTSIPSAPSATSGSTRSPPSSCATSSPRPPGRPAATLVFDHPTPAALARHLRDELDGPDPATDPTTDPAATPTAGHHPPGRRPRRRHRSGLPVPRRRRDPEQFWTLLAEGTDAIGAFPTDRGWDLDTLLDPTPAAPAGPPPAPVASCTRPASSTPGFFGMSPREALATDSQQRILLETTWEALERAGIDPPRCAAPAPVCSPA